MSSDKITCSKCFKTIQKNCSIVCEVCCCKFHKLCAKIDDDGAFNALNNFRNIVFNCDNCLLTSRNLIHKISLLSCEMEQIKMLLSQFLENNVKNNNLISSSHRSLPTNNTGLFPNLPIPFRSQSKQTTSTGSNNAKQFAANYSVASIPATDATPPTPSREFADNNSVAPIAVNNGAAACTSDNNTGLFPKLPTPPVQSKQAISSIGALLSVSNTEQIATNNFGASIAVNDAVAACTVDNISEMDTVALIENNVNGDDYVFDDTNGIGDVVIDNQSVSNANYGCNVNSEWNNVTRRKKPSRMRRVVFGQNNNSELAVALKFKWVHLSSFKPSVTEENIISYVMKHLKIDKEQLVCYKLVKKEKSMDDLKYVNFKLGITSAHYEGLFNPQLWSSAIKVRPFAFFPKIVDPQQQL